MMWLMIQTQWSVFKSLCISSGVLLIFEYLINMIGLEPMEYFRYVFIHQYYFQADMT